MATFTNKATLSFNGGSVESNTVTGTFLETLSVTKTALTEEYTLGSRITYVVSLVNSGSTPFSGLTLTDDLGGYPFGSAFLHLFFQLLPCCHLASRPKRKKAAISCSLL